MSARTSELSCAHGDVCRRAQENPFSVGGTWVREVGPVQWRSSPCRCTRGAWWATTMTLSIRLTDTNESVGSFTLIAERQGVSSNVSEAAAPHQAKQQVTGSRSS